MTREVTVETIGDILTSTAEINLPLFGDFYLAEMFWKMGLKSFKSFFANFTKVESVSLLLTREVLEERQKLEANIQGLQTKVKKACPRLMCYIKKSEFCGHMKLKWLQMRT